MATNTAPALQNLPLEPNSFVGRERDVSDILRLIEAHRVVTLCGVGGIGKTRLALRVAGHATSHFRDGVWLCELSDTTSRKEIITRMATAVGVGEEDGRDLEHTLADVLRSRGLLLVLDNCEHVVADVAAVVERLVALCPDVSFLVTSREPARAPGEAVWRVPPLAVPRPDQDDPCGAEAVRLFVDRARASAHDFTATPERLEVIAEICRRLDGIPLGIELAAARVRLLSVTQIAARLGDRFTVLTSGERGAPARQQTLRAVIDWSHGMLDERERVLLRRLSVFSNWNLDLAERVCADASLPAESLLDLVVSLVDRSLVTVAGEEQGRMRYRLLDTIRQYAAARLDDSGEEEALRLRHREQMLALAEELSRNTVFGHGMAWPQRVDVWYRVLVDYDNLRSALSWSATREDAAEGLRLCVALRPFWMVSGQRAEGAYWTDRFLAMGCADEGLRGQAMVRRAELAWDQRDHARAAHVGEEGLRYCRAAGDDDSVALALNILAMTDMRDRELDRARERLAEAVALTRAVGDPWNEGLALGTQGALAALEGRLDEAGAHYEEALTILRRIDHRWGVGRTLIGQGMVAEARGDLFGADQCFREALDIQRSIGGAPELARCLAGVGRISALQGAVAQAYDYLSESLALCHGTGQRLGVARGLLAIATVARTQGLDAEATVLAGAAAGVRERSGHPPASAPWPLRDGAFAARWEEGRSLDVDEAVKSALRLAETGRAPRRRPQAPDTAPSALTRREHEIALLIGEGMSNRSIAESLFISPATVARHVANIHTKLGFNSRTQIAAWIRDH
ncbi:helix-turn-helix transcriptional regulator [Actinorugispora endophytica]|uniref:Putative ATPase n=1 Tax=Actinorugispora endophytica TaxID=1605990 RepID=A0A4R6V4M4_9ACTN|nr:tetratricopeptide repeat protein [Actinorugispora endophytica]TDQ53812.1 putative ATPase [Actinorugispora endophytica]